MLSLACLFVSYNSMMIVVLMGEMTEDKLLVTFLRITLFVPILHFKSICLNPCTGKRVKSYDHFICFKCLKREDHGEVQEIRAVEELEMIVETKTKAPGDTTGSMRVTTPKEHSPGNALPLERRRFKRSLGSTQTEQELRRQKTRI